MLAFERCNRRLVFVVSIGLLTVVAGCSGSKTAPCTFQYAGGAAGSVSGLLLSPASGATGVPTSGQTLVYNALSQYSIVLQPASGGATVQTSPTALPSPYASSAAAGSTSGDHAVSLPTLQSATAYKVGTLSDVNDCAGNFSFRQFGTFTTQ